MLAETDATTTPLPRDDGAGPAARANALAAGEQGEARALAGNPARDGRTPPSPPSEPERQARDARR